jgi:hypothetical protein
MRYIPFLITLFFFGCKDNGNEIVSHALDNSTEDTELQRESSSTVEYLTEEIVLAEGKCWEQHVVAKEIDGVTKYVAPDDVIGVLFAGEVGVWTAIEDCSEYINNNPLNREWVDIVTVDCYSMDLENCQKYEECKPVTENFVDVYNRDRFCSEIEKPSLFFGCLREKDFVFAVTENETITHHTIFYNSQIDMYVTTYQDEPLILNYREKVSYSEDWQVDRNATREMWSYYEALGKENGDYYGFMLDCNSSDLKDLEF